MSRPKKRVSRLKVIVIVIAAVILLVLGMFTGVLPFAFYTIRCGKLPVVAITFAASYTYKVPGDPGYGPGIFNDEFFCSKEEAERARFHHDTSPF